MQQSVQVDKLSAQLESESFIKAKDFPSCADNRRHPEVPSMAVSVMQYICLPLTTTPRTEVYVLLTNSPTMENIWLKCFHYTGFCLALNLLPALVHASIAMNPSKTVELQQHKPTVSLPLEDSSVKTEVTSLCWSLLSPAEIHTCHRNGANAITAESSVRKLHVDKTATAETDQAPTALYPFIWKFSIELSLLNFLVGFVMGHSV